MEGGYLRDDEIVVASMQSHVARAAHVRARAALAQIHAFCETRMAEGTREHADMCHIASIAKEAL